jgi:IclR family transcriptional regulator, KDG regulon repressor
MRDQTEYNVRAVERAIQILNSFDDEHPERGVTEISEVVDLHKATTHRILRTLLNYGLIDRSVDGQKYKLGIQLVDLGFKVTRRMDMHKEALPFLSQLAQQLDEAVDLSLLDQMQVLYIEMIQSHHALTIAASVGRRLPVYCTASGKVFLAHISPDELKTLLEKPLTKFTNNTITDPHDLEMELKTIREKGFASDDEEYELGIRALAAPIYDQLGKVVSAVSIPGPKSRITWDRLPEISTALIATTQLISRRLGYKK